MRINTGACHRKQDFLRLFVVIAASFERNERATEIRMRARDATARKKGGSRLQRLRDPDQTWNARLPALRGWLFKSVLAPS